MKQKYFVKCMIRYSYWFVISLFMSYLLASIVVKGNKIIADAVDYMLSGQAVQFQDFIVNLLELTVLGFGAAFLSSFATSKFSIKVQTKFKNLVASKLFHLEYQYFDKNGSAAVINKMNADIAETDTFLNETFPSVCTNIVSAITYAVYVGRLNWKLLIVMLVCYPIILFFSHYIVKKIVKLKKAFREKSDTITEVAQDSMSGILVLRAFHAENYFQEKMNQAADALVENEEHRTRITNTALVVRKILQWLPNIICAIYAFFLEKNGGLSIGGLMAFIIVLGRFVDAFIGIPFDLVDAQENLVCVNRVEQILSEKVEHSGNVTAGKDSDTVIEFKNVRFGYHADQMVLKDLSFSIKRGSTTAFVGDSGGGKSTIFHIICGLYPVTAGRYELWGTDYHRWNIEAAREQMALVSQNVFLFPTTIEKNVAYGNEHATKEEIITACKNARIHDFIIGLPEGYDTVVGERGILLSGGERQRISIARAFLKDAPILLLDEPTSAIDVETEGMIEEAIQNISHNRTCVVIAHRLSTIQNADLIMALKGGCIAESGTHKELLKKNGIYAGMYGKEILEEEEKGENNEIA